MIRTIVALVVCAAVAAGVCGCSEEKEFLGGTARLTVVNGTSRHVHGIIDADKRYSYEVEAGVEETYSLAVGEGVLTHTEVIITAHIHETSSSSSAVVSIDTENIRMSEGKSYEYVIPFSGSPERGFRTERNDRPRSSITGL